MRRHTLEVVKALMALVKAARPIIEIDDPSHTIAPTDEQWRAFEKAHVDYLTRCWAPGKRTDAVRRQGDVNQP